MKRRKKGLSVTDAHWGYKLTATYQGATRLLSIQSTQVFLPARKAGTHPSWKLSKSHRQHRE